MRSRLNSALVVAAGSLALVLTVVRQSPEGVVSVGLDTQEVRAAPGQPRNLRHDLSALKIFNLVLVRIKERYVDPARIDPRKMLYAALDSVQYNIPEVLVEPDASRNKVTIAVNDKKEIFDTEDVDSPWRLSAKLKRIFRFIETNMNAGGDLAKVEYAAVNGMLSTLDPHSVLMDPEAARDMDVQTSGKFGGLGIVIRMIEKKLTVIKPMKDTPAWKKGIKAGDHIVRINNELTEHLTSNEAVERMRGNPSTPVTLWIERKGVDQLMRFDLTRDIIRMSQVESKLLDKGVGYIKVKQFSKGISSDVADALKTMAGKGATSWILDLRYNPGGLLEEAVQLSDLFVDAGTVVTTVSGRDREARRAERGFGDTTSSLVVLVNGGSASASEIVAGALKNLDRAVIVGTRTFGKGTVQELYDNEDRSKLKLTIAQYLTPGDRSIQNLGIVPDIQLQRMYVPDKNDAPTDFVRMLPPSHTYGEKDLDAALVSTYAKDNEKPAHEIPFIVDRKKPAPGDAPATAPPEDDEDPDDDVIEEDFEMRFAKELVAGVTMPSRPKLLAQASKVVQRVRGEEEKKLIAALSQIGVDWTAPIAQTDNANLEVTLATTAPTIKAGTDVSITATVKNNGTGTAFRVLPRLVADDSTFQDVELPVGKVGPGESKSFTAKIKVPQDAIDRVDRLGIEVREARNAPTHVIPAEVKIEALPRPVFAYSWHLVDDGNGDGLVQRGEKYKLLVSVKNTGQGPAQEATVLLRNATGDGVTLAKSRFELKDLAPGAQKEIEFPLSTDATLKADEVVLELMAYDPALDVSASDKLKLPVKAGIKGETTRGEVTTKQALAIRAGASEDASVVGGATKGASYRTVGRYGQWIKVALTSPAGRNESGPLQTGPAGRSESGPLHSGGGSRVGFVPESAVSAGGSGQSSFTPYWHSTPPQIALATKTLDTSGSSYRLQGTVTDETHVEDVYIFVGNQGAKIENRKVFYRSNRGGKDDKMIDFAADLPLWPGSNMVTIIARENSEVRSVKYLYLYRDPPRTASTKP